MTTLGADPLRAVVLAAGMVMFSAAFVLTWPIVRAVNPSRTVGVAVAALEPEDAPGGAVIRMPSVRPS